METTKKKTEDNLVTVDVRKLSIGLKTTFEGVVMIFDSIGVDAGLDELKRVVKSDAAENLNESEPPNIEKEVKDESQVTENGDAADIVASDDDASDDPVATQDDEITTEDTGQNEGSVVEKETENKPPNNISQDDITKIIVQKIRVDRSKNETIGQILKTYGVSKVSDLPSSKYEAFLTDLAAI